MRPARFEDLVAFLRNLDDALFLPALWLVRRSDLGAIMEDYEPDESLLELIEDRLFTQDRNLYEFIHQKREEN